VIRTYRVTRDDLGVTYHWQGEITGSFSFTNEEQARGEDRVLADWLKHHGFGFIQ
jgi:hypothetical protein